MTSALSGAAAIVGAAEADEIGFLEEPKSSLQLHIEAIKNVSEQTGIPLSKVDGIFSTGWSSELCEHLGLKPKFIDTTACGGCSSRCTYTMRSPPFTRGSLTSPS